MSRQPPQPTETFHAAIDGRRQRPYVAFERVRHWREAIAKRLPLLPLAGILLACQGGDSVTAVTASKMRVVDAVILSGDCSSQIIPDESCNQASGGGASIRYDSIPASGNPATSTLTWTVVPQPGENFSSGHCPLVVDFSSVAQMYEPTTMRQWRVPISGRGRLNIAKSVLFWPMGHGVYDMPAGPNPDGSWPGSWTDPYDMFGGGIGSVGFTWARANCNGGPMPYFYLFFPVKVSNRDLGFYSPAGGGGGSSSGSCVSEWTIVEINRGSGWQVLWEGLAWVCT